MDSEELTRKTIKNFIIGGIVGVIGILGGIESCANSYIRSEGVR